MSCDLANSITSGIDVPSIEISLASSMIGRAMSNGFGSMRALTASSFEFRLTGRWSDELLCPFFQRIRDDARLLADEISLFDRYYVPAGVSMHWLESIMPVIKGANLWQTTASLPYFTAGSSSGVVSSVA